MTVTYERDHFLPAERPQPASMLSERMVLFVSLSFTESFYFVDFVGVV